MLRFAGNSISLIPPPISLFVVLSNETYQLLDTSNAVYTNSTLLTLVQNDISTNVPANSKKYTVDGCVFSVDFTRLNL
jgi:hypothetical protein